MKLLILTLVGLSIGFSEAYDSLHPPRPEGFTDAETLKAFFDIKKEDVDAKCDKVDDEDQTTRWGKIEKTLQALQTAVISNDAFDGSYKYQKEVIKTALPCASDKEVDKKLDFYKNLPQEDPRKTEPQTEPINQTKTEPITEPKTEPTTEPTTEPKTEPITEPKTEPTTEPKTEPITEPTTEPKTEPITEPKTA